MAAPLADISLDQLKNALVAEGVKIKDEILDRLFRKLANPSGCEFCGQPTKVAVEKGGALVTACCNAKVADMPKPEDPAEQEEAA